ncbi:ABC transporter, partial [Candidatus Shapirobacteria bacterium CG_4_8_14_3_um_filter_35_11]
MGEKTKVGFTALDDISFEIKRGETVGIIGPNGSGKSTILKLVAGVMSPTSGKVFTQGKISPLIELGAGMHPELTGRENIYLNGAILGLKKTQIKQYLQEIIDFSEIEEFIDQPIKHYSSGMYMRLAFSIAIHVNPEILLVDEILAVGDT